MAARRTKIVATLGPACRNEAILREMLQAGVDVIRVNFSHVDSDFIPLIELARQIAKELNRPLAIMADLQGPKIRIGRFKTNFIKLESGQHFTLFCNDKEGDQTGVSVDYHPLCSELVVDDHLLLDDGLIELKVTAVGNASVECVVLEGGVLRNNKGINRKGGGLAAPALTEKDKADMAVAIKANIDYITLSFVKQASDVREMRLLLRQLGAPNIPIIAKIERVEALDNLTAIIQEANAIMVARGDLGVEVGAAEIPAIQKQIIEQTRSLNKIVITATQMMESMIEHPQPTRAEVSDVANAILDGTDAVMLSAETASGKYPVKVIQMVDKTCISAEKHAAFLYQKKQQSCHYQHSDQAIAMGAMHIANHFPIQVIIALTESGETAIWMSRLPSAVPIYAVTTNPKTVSKLSLVNNVFPLYFDYGKSSRSKINRDVIDFLLQNALVTKNAFILLTRGSMIGQPGGTNRMEIIRVS